MPSATDNGTAVFLLRVHTIGKDATYEPFMVTMTLPSRMVDKPVPRSSVGYPSCGSGFPSPMLPNSKKQQQKTDEWFEVASIEYGPTQL